MGSRQKKKVPYLYKGRGPGLPPALSIVVMAYLVFAFLDTQPAFPLDFKSFQPYTTPSGGGDARVGSGDSQFDAQRVMRRNLLEQRQKKEEKTRGEEKQQSTQQTQEVEQNVVQTQRVSQAIAQQGEREADFIYNRTTGLDSYSVDKDGGVWRQHLSLLVEAWNVLSRDLFGNGSRSHLTDFKYNDLLNATGMKRETKDQAGRATETVISGITYMPGQSPRNFLSQNKEAKRAEVTTTFHPTGNQVTQTELYDLVYDGDNVVAQKARITDLSGPTPVVIQETTGITYDGESNVSASHTRVTDLETGIVTESDIKNEFSDHRLISGVTKSVTKDSINHTFTEQTFTQKVSYGDSGIQTIDARSIATTQAMDEKGNPVDDFVQTTETLQKMGLFFNIPNPVEVSSVTKTVDNVGVQTTESKQMQRQLRDDHGNLLGISATEVATTVNADRSVVQETKSNLDFMVRADQPYLIGREDNTFTKDLINEQNIFTTSRLRIQLGALGEVLEGFRTGKTHAANGDGSIVSDSEFTQTFDRASKVNALGLVKQETSSRTVNTIDESVSTETRLYTQTHDEMNRVLSAAEAVKGLTTNSRGGETHVEGAVDYAIGKRTNQAYAISSTNNITSKDLGNRLYTESVQTNAYASDENTGRAIGGTGITDSFSQRMLDDGTLLDIFTIHGRSEEIFVGLAQANGFGMASRNTHTEVREVANNVVTDRDEILTQRLNGVGKIEEASAIARSTTQDLGRTGVFKTDGFVRTEFRIIGNSPIPTDTRSVEVTVSHIDSSYRVVARHDATRYDPYGRILPIDEEKPSESGFELLFYEDVMVQPIPKRPLSPEQLFQNFFGATGPR